MVERFHPITNRRISDDPVFNKLVFNGYHLKGEWLHNHLNPELDSSWKPYHDHYFTLEDYYRSFSYVRDRHVLSAREIYRSHTEDDSRGERHLVITDNDGKILWDAEKEKAERER